MMTRIDITCPHCDETGELTFPPCISEKLASTALFIAPCPNCHNPVIFFNGCVLPLEKDIFEQGSDQEKVDHVCQTLFAFLRVRISNLLGLNIGHRSGYPSFQPNDSGLPISFEEAERIKQQIREMDI